MTIMAASKNIPRIPTAKVRKAEDALGWMQGAIGDAERGNPDECRETFEFALPYIEAAKNDLTALGMYDAIKSAAQRALELAMSGKFAAAQKQIASVNRPLAEASGSNDALRRRYGLKKREQT